MQDLTSPAFSPDNRSNLFYMLLPIRERSWLLEFKPSNSTRLPSVIAVGIVAHREIGAIVGVIVADLVMLGHGRRRQI